MAPALSSAKGMLALLRESDNAVLLFALRRLGELMDTFWYEISVDLPLIEELHETTTLPLATRQLAALVASQVYFHLGAYNESVHYALAAGAAFDHMPRSLYTDTILSRCIDQYVEYQERTSQEAANMAAAAAAGASGGATLTIAGDAATATTTTTAAAGASAVDAATATTTTSAAELDPRLEGLFVSLTKAWLLQDEGMDEVKELVGFTIRARRLDFLEKVLRQCVVKTRSADILTFTFRVVNVLLRDIAFRRKVLRLLSSLFVDGLVAVDYFALAQCLIFLGDVDATAGLMVGLLKANNRLVAYQLAFDLFQHGSQGFLSALIAELQQRMSSSTMTTTAATTAAAQDAAADDTNANMTTTTTTDAPPTSTSTATAEEQPMFAKLLTVLTGEVTTNLHLKFLYARCAADVHVLNQIKRSIDPKKSIVHNATVMANAFMYCGTTIDGFLRDNITWLSKANYWAKFTAIAAIGVIHRGHISDAMKVMQPYLPSGGGSGSVPALPYQEAGALYALGLIHSPVGVLRDRATVHFLRDSLQRYAANTQMVHGASLGLGLAAMGLQDEDLYDALFACVPAGDAVGGEAAAVGVGMLMMGSGNAAVVQSLENIAAEEMQKEKIIRGTSMALALISLGREDEALPLASRLLDSADPWVRLGGCFVLGLAFAGTENRAAIERLLYVTVKDTSDDVRRNAVTMIGFLTFKDPSLCLDLVRTLVDSYNPHIRYGVAMALAISGAGSGRADIIDLLWEMKDDLVNYVRQGVYMALALVMVQLTERENGKVKELTQLLSKKIGDRKEDVCTKFGCIVATGLLDVGGRNCTFALHRDRHRLDKAVVGMFMFTQHWFWFPYALMLALATQPTCFIGLNDELEMPEYTFRSNAAPSYYAVPKSVLQEKKEVKAAGVQAVVLSTTRKEEELRLRRKRGAVATASTTMTTPPAAAATAAGGGNADGGSKQAGQQTATAATATAVTGAAAGGGGGGKKSSGGEDATPPEPEFELLHNPARVTAHQFDVVVHNVDQRYVPLKQHPMGVCLLRDTRPELGAQQLIDAIVVTDQEEAPLPEPFAYP